MSEPRLLRLSDIEVKDLFGLYNHSVKHNLDERVTILHGPNGIGKTVVLRMVNALLDGDLDFFREIPFSRFSLGFDNGARLTLADQKTEEDDGLRTVWVKLSGVDDEDVTIKLTWPRNEAADANEQYASRSAIRSFQRHTNAHLIETQCLFKVELDDRPEHAFDRNRDQATATILDYASDYQRRFTEALALYGRKSQALDQSFPVRLFSEYDDLYEDADVLRIGMAGLNQKQSDLKTLEIFDNETPAHPFDDADFCNLGETESRAMSLYVDDTYEKLSALDDFAERTRLLVQNVNKKFLNRGIRISRKHGITGKSDQGKLLAPETLSSGEQHLLILLYDLLFHVRQNTIVLIDEPESSLHVAWQKQFLPELLEIIRTANFDAIVATHSPFIVGDHADLMVGLGEDAE